MKWKRLLAALLAALCLLGGIEALAATPRPTVTPGPTRAIDDAGFAVPEPPRCFYVLDEADVLPESTESNLYFTSRAAYNMYGVQLVVVTVDSTDGVDIGDYAYTLYDQWGIGTMKCGSGLLLLLAVNDGGYCVVEGPNREIGYNLLDWLVDHEASFSTGDYGQFAECFSSDYIYEMIRRSDGWPHYKDFPTYDDYNAALIKERFYFDASIRRTQVLWVSAGREWDTLVAKGGGGCAYSAVIDRRNVLEKVGKEERERQEREQEAAHRALMNVFREIGIILLLIGFIVLIVIDLQHGGHFTVFLLRVLIEALVSGSSDSDSRGSRGGGGGRSSGGGGSRPSGGGGSFSGGGAGRGR